MKCNSPKRQVQSGKKFVVKGCEDGIEKIIRFGDANMKIENQIPMQENHSEQDIDVILLMINLVQDIGLAKTGNNRRKLCTEKK